jgi:NhaA family Na+:H+ antiporter
MATDIALAVGALGLLGSLVKPSIKLFLLTLAIVDDVGAIVVIALFYANSIGPEWFAAGVAVTAVIVGMQRVGVSSPIAYVVPALVLWVCLQESGVHATIAGVALGLLTPARPVKGRHVLERLEDRFHPISSFVIVPLFALANAGIVLTRSGVERAVSGTIGLGIIAGLLVGKTLGIFGATALGVRCRVGRLPNGVRLADVAAVAAVAGIGFTVSLFVADLAYRGRVLEEAKISVLVASMVAATVGMLLVALEGRRSRS